MLLMVAFIACGLLGVMLPIVIFSLRAPSMKSNHSFKQVALASSLTHAPIRSHPLANPIIYGTAWKKERTTELVMTAVQTG